MKKILLITLLFPVLALAETANEIVIGEQPVLYDNVSEADGAVYYYYEGDLAASTHETASFVYENDQAVLEAQDTDGDGVLDAFITLDNEARLVEVTGTGSKRFTEGEPVEFEDLMTENGGSVAGADPADEDLVGSLDRITIPKHGGFPWWLLLLLAAAGGYWYFRNQSSTIEE